MKDHIPFHGEILAKTITKSPETLGQFQPNLAQSILERRELKEGITNKVRSILKKEIFVFSSPNRCYDIIILIILVSRVSDVANGPMNMLVLIQNRLLSVS